MSGESYTDGRYDMVHTHHFPTILDTVAGATGVEGAASRTNLFRLPFKAKLIRFGIIPVTNTMINATEWPIYALKLESPYGEVATELATFKPGYGTLTQWEATGRAPEVATTIPANRVVMPCTATASASKGSVLFFMDYKETFVSG